MNRLYLDKLLDFTQSTYANCYVNSVKMINLQEEITKVKQNTSLNEKGSILKYNFVDLASVTKGTDFSEMVLIYPICFNVSDCVEWYNLLNCLLLVMNEDYLKESNITKKKILQIADKMYRKQLIISDTITDENYKKISELTNVNLIIICADSEMNLIKEYKSTQTDKWIVCLKYENDYFPVWNYNKKYYSGETDFIKVLQSKSSKVSKQKEIPVSTKVITKDDDKHKVKESEAKINDGYEEFVTNENYALYISEAVDVKTTKTSKSKSKKTTEEPELKKVKKTNKNIFVTLENNVPEPEQKDESVFKKTDKITKEQVSSILANIKQSTKLEQIQAYAIELNICIVSGSTKDGKPKNKTRAELIEEIKQTKKQLKK